MRNSSVRRKSTRTLSKSSEDKGSTNFVESNQPSSLSLAKQILSKQKSANKSLDTTQSVRIAPSGSRPSESNETMEVINNDLLNFITVNSAELLQHIADSVGVTHPDLPTTTTTTITTASAPKLNIREEKRKKPPKRKERAETEVITEQEGEKDKRKKTEVSNSLPTSAEGTSEETTPIELYLPERKRPWNLPDQESSTVVESSIKPITQKVRAVLPHPPVIMPVIRKPATEDKKVAPEEIASPSAIREKIHMDFEEMDEALRVEAAANVERIRAVAIQRIAESRSQGAQLSNTQIAAQDSEILKYVEVTADTSALNLLRELPTHEMLVKRQKRSVGVPPPTKRNGPPPPWAPRSHRPPPDSMKTRAPPNGHISRPVLRSHQSLKRVQPHQGHAITNNVPVKMAAVESRGESSVVSSSTPTQHQVKTNVINNIQLNEPKKEEQPEETAKKVRIPVGVNPATPCFQYLQSLNPGKPIFRGMQQGYRDRKAKPSGNTNGVVLHLPVQRLQTQPPGGQVLGTFPLRRNANGSMTVIFPEERKEPEVRQVVIEPPRPPNGLQPGQMQTMVHREQQNKVQKYRNGNPVPNFATRQNAPNVQHLIRVGNNQQTNLQTPAENRRLPYVPQKSVPYVPSSFRGISSSRNGTAPPRKSNNSTNQAEPETPLNPTLVDESVAKNIAEKNREEHIAMAKEIKQEIIEEEEAQKIKEEEEAVEHNTPAAPVPTKQSHKPPSMPGLITPQSLFNGLYPGTMEQLQEQFKKGQQMMKDATEEIALNLKKQNEANANFHQPTQVIWKNKSITVPEFMRCELCKGLMSLWIDIGEARKKYDRLFPAYKCNGCPSIRSIARKFDQDEKIAESSWPTVKLSSPPKLTRDFDEELKRVMGPYLPKDLKKKDLTKNVPPKRLGPLRTCRDAKNHLSENFHCGCPASSGVAAEDAEQSIPSDTVSSSTSEPKVNVAQAVENPRMPNEIANIITKRVVVGDTSTYNLRQLIQKVLVVSGRVQSEETTFDPAVLETITARDFMETMTTFLMSQSGFQNTVFVKDP